MAGIGGSIESVTMAGRVYSVAADADAQIKLGGFENDVQPNGDGSARKITTRVPWSVDGLAVEIDDGNGDHEFLQALSDLNDFFPVALTLASGAVWQGNGTITGELQRATQATTAAVSLMGPAGLTLQ